MARGIDSDNKKKNVRVADGPRAPGFARSLAETLGMFFRPLVPLTTLIVVYAGISYLLWRPLNSEAGGYESSAQKLLPEKALYSAFASNSRPPWMSIQDYRQIAIEGAAAAKNHSVFEAGLSRKLASTFERNSWVERVREVRLRFPARMELELDFRKPCAKLDRGAVLDRRGFGLNLSSDSPAARDLPTLCNVAKKNPGTGQQTTDKAVTDALDLLAVVRDTLAKAPGNLRVTSIEQKDAMWRIATDRGLVIMWGAFTDDPPIDEPRTHEKAELLRKRLCEWNPALLEYVKVYIAQAPVKLRALAGAQEITTPPTPARAQQ